MDLRPRPDQTDEDLLRENVEFLNASKRKSVCEGNATHLPEEVKKRQKPTENVEDYMHNDPIAILSKAKSPNLLISDIIEKNIEHNKCFQRNVLADSVKHGFPVAYRRNRSLNLTSGKSIFARMQQEQPAKEKFKVPSAAESRNIDTSEAQRIHEENLQKLSNMSHEEIITAQQELLSRLNPSTVQLLKSKGAAKTTKISQENKTQPMEVGVSIPTTTLHKPLKISDTPMEIEELEGIPIEPREAIKWLHMDVVETEKLRWMTQLPPPKAIAPGQSYTARFNFDGTLLDPNVELPVTKALHHHGEEQERAGYTLEELLLFSRSTVPQQRTIGLTTIANILALSKQGRLDQCLEEPILPKLVSAGIFAALRFSLDEGVPMVMEAAAQALAALMCSEPDEVCLRQLRGTSYAATLPGLICPLEAQGLKEKGQEAVQEGELKDHELLQLDVVKGAMRTHLIPRIRYVLTQMKPSPRTVQCLLRVLARLAMHSRDVAMEVSGCHDLLLTIITNFVPVTWEASAKLPTEMESVYGMPQARALWLLRVLASQSRAIASDLVHKHGIMKSLLTYLAMEPCETGIPDGSSVVLESLYLWQTLLSHGLTIGELREFSAIIGRFMSHHCAQTRLGGPRFLAEHAVALLSLLQTVLVLTPTKHSDKIPKELLVGLGPPILRATAGWLTEVTDNSSLTFIDLKLVGAGLNTVSAGYIYALQWKEVDEIVWLSELEVIVRSVVLQFLQNSTLSHLVDGLMSYSSLLCAEAKSGNRRDPHGLPSLGAVMFGQIVTPSLQTSSPIPLLEPLFAFLLCVCQLLPHTALHLVDILQQPGIRAYMLHMSTKGCAGAGHWFSRWEERLACCLLSLAIKVTNISEPRIFHCAALNLLPALSFKHLAAELMSTWVFSKRAFQDDFPSELLSSLQIKEVTSQLPTLTTSQPTTHSELLHQALENLDNLMTCYSVLPELSVDWPYLPLVTAAGNIEQSKLNAEPKQLKHCLQWLLLLEYLRPEVISRMLSPTGRFCRVSCVFLCGSDVFLDPYIHALAEDILRNILLSGDLDFTEDIPGLKSFWELFEALTRAFVAESYGDTLFCNVILLPLRQGHDPAYKKHIWGEQSAAIRYLRLEPSQLLVNMKDFLVPPENDVTLLSSYLRMLLTGTVRGVLAYVAVVHLQHYVKHGSDKSLCSHIATNLATAPAHVKETISSVSLQFDQLFS